ncbi:hypothetical protein CEXT_619111 [Caerostris extrusa]|uniref:Uncharacterized protein n=1 Tax=Caerostris extrusa TaxID=172846 RepID=A0AAV4XLV3_CAEEX|nr:hypothetical protein CEXT_619111 [Caerostris extrusa]
MHNPFCGRLAQPVFCPYHNNNKRKRFIFAWISFLSKNSFAQTLSLLILREIVHWDTSSCFFSSNQPFLSVLTAADWGMTVVKFQGRPPVELHRQRRKCVLYFYLALSSWHLGDK